MPSLHTLSGEKVPCSRGCHWKRCCAEAASSGIKAFGHSWGEYPLKINVVASGTKESPLLGQTRFCRCLFPLNPGVLEGDPLCVLVCEAHRRQTSVQDKQKLD